MATLLANPVGATARPGGPPGPSGPKLRFVRVALEPDKKRSKATTAGAEQQQEQTASTLRFTVAPWVSPRALARGAGVVIGDQELVDDIEAIKQHAMGGADADPDYVHVFLKSADVQQVTVSTLLREMSLCNAALASLLVSKPPAPPSPRSALTSQLLAASGHPTPTSSPPSTPRPAPAAATSLVPWDAAAAAAAAPSQPPPPPSGRAVIHLMVHKGAKVAWHHLRDDSYQLSISGSDTIDSLLARVEGALRLPRGCPGARVLHKGEPLGSDRPLVSYGVGRGSVLELVPVEPPAAAAAAAAGGGGGAPSGGPPPQSPAAALAAAPASAAAARSPPPSLSSPAHALHAHFAAARAGLDSGQAPRLAPSGTGGSYFLYSPSGAPVAVFKPLDEEPLAANNPKGRGAGGASPEGEGLRRGVMPGEGAIREVAAYLLDHDHFAGVPPTALVSAYVGAPTDPAAAAAALTAGVVGAGGCERARKVGSLQQFVAAEGDMEERGVSGFPPSEVHKIAVLDLRLGNTDRNGGNILARKAEDGALELVPIDHGYTFPASLEDLSFEWLFWPQAEAPFDERTRRYIAALDADADIAALSAAGLELRPECLRVFRVLTMLLQKGAARALNAYQLGCIASRPQPAHRSPLEKLHQSALRIAGGGRAAAPDADEGAYLAAMSRLLDEYLEEEGVLTGEDLML